MPIRKSPKGHFIATYGGKIKTFKTRAAAEKWASQFEVAKVSRGRRGRKAPTPKITDYNV